MKIMTVDEVRAIREKISLETINMTAEELCLYFARGANDIERRIAEIRSKRGITLESSNDVSTEKSKQKNEHAFIRGVEYYANLSKTNASANAGSNIAVHESTESYDSND